MNIKTIKNYTALLAIATYGLMLLPYDNDVSVPALFFVAVFLFTFLLEVKKSYFILLTSTVFWLSPFIFGSYYWGVENSLRAAIPILLLIYVASIKLRELDSRFIILFMMVSTFVVVRYLLLIISEVLIEQQAFESLFSGSTRALINEPILIGYYLFGLWVIFFPQSLNRFGVLSLLVKVVTIFILLMATLFQVRFFIAAFALIGMLKGGWFFRMFVSTSILLAFVYLPKFSGVSLQNGKIEQFNDVVIQVGGNLLNGLGLGALRDDIFLGPVRFTDNAPPLIFLYGGVLGLIWYVGIFTFLIYKYRSNTLVLGIVMILPLLHSQLIQSGFKMFGMIALPFYFMIQTKLNNAKNE